MGGAVLKEDKEIGGSLNLSPTFNLDHQCYEIYPNGIMYHPVVGTIFVTPITQTRLGNSKTRDLHPNQVASCDTEAKYIKWINGPSATN